VRAQDRHTGMRRAVGDQRVDLGHASAPQVIALVHDLDHVCT
jgi:hypothetical protein